jgi:hypothetical protein
MGKSLPYALDRKLGEPQTQYGHGDEEKKIESLPLREIEIPAFNQ